MINTALRRRRWLGQRRGGFIPANWRPTRLSGLVLWLRADLGISLNGSNVSAWADQSTSGINPSQGTGAAQPAYSATSFNGHPGITFASASSQLLKSSTANPFGVGPFTIFIAWSWVSLPGSVRVAMSTSSAGFGDGAWFGVNGTTRQESIPGGTASNGGTVTTATPEIVCFSQAAGNNADIYVNSVQTGTAGASAFTNPTSGFIQLGGITGGFTDSILAEVIGFNRQLSAIERAAVTKYMGARYGISV